MNGVCIQLPLDILVFILGKVSSFIIHIFHLISEDDMIEEVLTLVLAPSAPLHYYFKKYSLNQTQTLWYMDDCVFGKSIFYLFSNVSSVILHSLSRNCLFFYFYFKKCRTYITLTLANISNNIIKQNYGIIKTFKVLLIVKKKQFGRINILIKDRSITPNNQAFFHFKNIFMMPICQDDKLDKR